MTLAAAAAMAMAVGAGPATAEAAVRCAPVSAKATTSGAGFEFSRIVVYESNRGATVSCGVAQRVLSRFARKAYRPRCGRNVARGYGCVVRGGDLRWQCSMRAGHCVAAGSLLIAFYARQVSAPH
ncbi:MAG: hypothetical protein R2736_17360 [Solirubrobacterales bacterium]